MNEPRTLFAKRHWQKAVPPVEFPDELRARLQRTGWNMADKFRREEVFQAYRPKVAEALARDHMAIAGEQKRMYLVPCDYTATRTRVASTWTDAQTHTLAQHRELQKAHLTKAFDEQQIRDFAENYARACAKMLTLEHRADFAQSLGIEAPTGPKITVAGACARMDGAKWWRRQLRATWNRRAENVYREIGIVRRGRETYASDDAVMARQVQKARGRAFLEGHVATNEAGEQLSLIDLWEGSTSNPTLRRGEFMCRMRGFEGIADTSGHEAQFYTLTAPSMYHAQLAAGVKNPKYQGADARATQAWLCKQWGRCRAKLKRLSILMYGVRVAEPHHDGTPHWHLLLFCRRTDAATIAKVIRDYWVNAKGFAEELGPIDQETGRRRYEEARYKLITIDRTKGSATGYVAKYISKNIDGAGTIGGQEDQETGKLVSDGVRRVDAWAALHGIRQFQQIGGPPVGLWREVRRITESCNDPDLERVRAVADVGDWAGFIRALSFDGIRAGRRVACRLERKVTGELSSYAEEKTPAVVGVRYCSAVEITRRWNWRIEPCENDTGTSGTITCPENTRGSAAAVPVSAFSENWHPKNALAGLGLGRLNPLNPNYWGRKRRRRTHRPEVMNPPQPPAPGCEAGNLNMGHAMAADPGRSGGGARGTRRLRAFILSGSGSDPTWTRGNNCTRQLESRKCEEWVRSWFKKHGRYPTLAETIEFAAATGPP